MIALHDEAFGFAGRVSAGGTVRVRGDALKSRKSLWTKTSEDADGGVSASWATWVAGKTLELGNGRCGVGSKGCEQAGGDLEVNDS